MGEEMQPLVFETDSINDLVRLAVSVILPTPIQIFHVKQGGKHIYFCMVPTIGFTGAKPVPAIYFTKLDDEIKGTYALIKSDGEPEQIEFSEATRRGWHAVVIVNLKKVPEKIKFN
ncbi:MAG: hypothetical protein ACTSQY_06025 [Candidatus Odinarchaeia archaeon]